MNSFKAIHGRNCNFSAFLLTAVWLLFNPQWAYSQPLTWYLDGVTFNTSATASGSFKYDADNNIYSDINITILNSPGHGDNTYVVINPNVGSNGFSVRMLTEIQPDLTGQSILLLSFATHLTTAGGTIDLVPGPTSYQAFCANPDGSIFNSPFDDIVTGRVTTSLVFTSPSAADVPENTTLVHTMTANDPNTTFTVVGLPTGPGIFNLANQLGAEDSVTSDDGSRTMIMQSDGNLVIYNNGAVDWASGTQGNTGAFARVSEFSNFRVFLVPGGGSIITLWESGTEDLVGFQGVYGKVENNGQVVLLRPDGQKLWESTLGSTTGDGTAFSLPSLDPFYTFGADNFHFEVVNGELHFRNAPDFENPLDLTGDNIYEVSVLADDGNGRQAVQIIQVMVTDDAEVLLGDVNLDGVVNLLDVQPFVNLLSSGVFQAEADINLDGIVNLLDVDPFVALLSN